MKMSTVFDFEMLPGELAERLRHEPRLQPHLRFAHLAFDFGARHERRHRVDDDDVDAARADEHLDDLERLLAVVGLRHQQVVDLDAELLGVLGVERVLGVDEGGQAAGALRFGNDLQRQRRLARRLGSEDLGDAAAGQAADAERVVDADGAGRNGLGRGDGVACAEPHDRALAELLLDLAHRNFERFDAFLAFVHWHKPSFRKGDGGTAPDRH